MALFCFSLQEEEVSFKQFLKNRYDDARIPVDVGQRNHGKNCCTRSEINDRRGTFCSVARVGNIQH